MPRRYEDPFRPAYEGLALLGWSASTVALLATHTPAWPVLSLGTLAMACWRGMETTRLFRFRLSIAAHRAQKMPIDHVLRHSQAAWARGGFWLGRGFEWEQRHAELARMLANRSPIEIPVPPAWLPTLIRKALEPADFVDLQDSAVGVPWIHGMETTEHDQLLPFDALTGHTLVVGTTRSGKTQFYNLLCTQIIHRGDPLIIIDPKGDKGWEHRLREECRRTGRKFLYFNTATPSQSIRINPLANWHTTAEPASRLSRLVDAEGTFAAFAWKTLYRIMSAMVADGSMPTIRDAKKFVERGVEPLLEQLLRKLFMAREGAQWDADLAQYKADAAKGGKTAQVQSSQLLNMIGKFIAKGYQDEAIEGLIAMVNHAKDHYSKMIQVLEPLLAMLGSGELGSMLSPDPYDLDDPRPIYSMQYVIEERAVLYVALGSLSNKVVGSAIGSILLSDLAATIGHIYDFQQQATPLYLVVDEAAEVVDDSTVQLLNKGGGAGLRAFIATQTIADLTAVFGDEAKSRQALGNLNNVIALRVKDMDMAIWLADTFGTTSARDIRVGHTTSRSSNTSLLDFSGGRIAQMSETEIHRVSPNLLTQLPGLQAIAMLRGAQCVKLRLPIIA